MRTTHQRPRKRRGHETQRVDRTARPRGSRSWPQAPRLSAIARRWLLGPRLKSCPQGQLKHRRYSLSGALANSRTCFPRSTAIAPCPLTDQRHTAGLARPGDPHRGAGRPRPPDLPADRDWSPRGNRRGRPRQAVRSDGLGAGVARWSGGPQLSRPPPRGDGAAAASPTARTQPGSADGPAGTAQGRRVGADEMSDPASATLSAPPRERPTRAAWRPTTDFAPPKWAGSTLQPHAAGRRAGRVDRRRRRPYRNCGTGAPSASLLPSHPRGRRDTALTVVTASRWERARRGQPPRRLQGTTCERVVRPGADDCTRWTKRSRMSRRLGRLLFVQGESQVVAV